MNKKSKILKVFSFIVVAFVLMLSIFAFIPQKENNINSASAVSDTVVDSYRFNGSNVMVYGIMQGNSNYNTNVVGVFSDIQISFYSGNPNGYIQNHYSTYVYINNQRFSYEQTNNVFPNYQSIFRPAYISGGTSITSGNAITFDNWIGNDNADITLSNTGVFALTDSGSSTRALLVGISLSSYNFNSNVYRAEMGLRDNALVLPSSTMSIDYRIFYIRYFDVNDNYIDFEFYTPSNYQFTTRTYLFTSGLSDNQFYEQGYNAGLSANQDNVYNQGFNAGKIDGYNQGFNAGVSNANDYTFNGLFSAVIDAPLQTFSGLFNFELLGVNLLGFITGLITLIVSMYIIKICIGG